MISNFKIKILKTHKEFVECCRIQKLAWEFENDYNIVPPPIFVLSRDFGGLVIGAFSDKKLIGFSLAFPLLHKKELVLHSHMTAVIPEFQGKGIGRALKLRQRELAIKMGYKTITWTFDPFVVRNAYFNFRKLGIVVKEVKKNYYGEIKSKYSKGFPTHRFIALWELKSKRVERAISGKHETETSQKIYYGYDYEIFPDEISFWVEIPKNHKRLKNSRKIYDNFIEFSKRITKDYYFNDFVIKGEKCFYHLKKR